MLSKEEIELAKQTTYFGYEWTKRDGTPCCVAKLAIHRGARVYYSHEYNIMVFNDYNIVGKVQRELAEWLSFYTHDGIPSPELLHKHLNVEKSKVFKRATY